ncbi:hypothetical protein DPMN_146058 [Dreissena polymorpha]|uniref:Uncharacterized protein n=1 Tax=Dreissena polymorpha TaxID=45954 RepID=A0A9D4J1Y6_DREPO|nr:hypothetical protein DPMN_146058 [Dreissena polymorpha]
MDSTAELSTETVSHHLQPPDMPSGQRDSDMKSAKEKFRKQSSTAGQMMMGMIMMMMQLIMIKRRWLRDREVPGSNPALTTEISLSKKFVPHLLLSTQGNKPMCSGCILRQDVNGRLMTQ